MSKPIVPLNSSTDGQYYGTVFGRESQRYPDGFIRLHRAHRSGREPADLKDMYNLHLELVHNIHTNPGTMWDYAGAMWTNSWKYNSFRLFYSDLSLEKVTCAPYAGFIDMRSHLLCTAYQLTVAEFVTFRSKGQVIGYYERYFQPITNTNSLEMVMDKIIKQYYSGRCIEIARSNATMVSDTDREYDSVSINYGLFGVLTSGSMFSKYGGIYSISKYMDLHVNGRYLGKRWRQHIANYPAEKKEELRVKIMRCNQETLSDRKLEMF